MLTLIHIGYSPYSERAKWALDHHGVAYREREFLPMISDLEMRLRFGGDFTIPALYGDGVKLGDSYAIAGYADDGKGELFPAGHEDRIRELHALSERALHLGRALLVAATARSDGALRENLVILPKPM